MNRCSFLSASRTLSNVSMTVLICRAVWHQANPITKGTRWALVIFYKVFREDDERELEK